jgi:diguanylate cyclase (GGDEF)-like protein
MATPTFYDTNSAPESQHILVLEDSSCRRTIVLEDSQYSLGRHSGCSIQIASAQASRHHATLVRKFNNKFNREIYLIIDGDLDGNKSQNGIFVNGSKCLVHELKDGDLINFGCQINASYHCINYGQSQSQPAGFFSTADSFTTSNAERQTLSAVPYPARDTNPGQGTVEEMSYLDPTTNLPNQVLFLEYFNIALSNAERAQHQVGLILIQIRNWSKLKNDYGDSIYTLVLSRMGQQLKTSLRNGDIVARWGQNEFIVLLSQIRESDNVENIARRLLQCLITPKEVQGKVLQLDLSQGVAIYPQDGDNVETLTKILRQHLQPSQHPDLIIASPDSGFFHTHTADTILPDKSTLNFAQLNLATLTDVNEDAERERLLKVEKRIQRALRKSELELYYQPQINIYNQEIEAMESLIRWLHPTQGMIAPRQFLPWSDQTDMVLPLTEWILQTACSQNRTWQSQGLQPVTVAVNLSNKQFYHPNLTAIVQSALVASQLEPRWLELEITESTILEDFESAQSIIRTLDERGIKIALDDFGVDYASIRYLQALPIDKLKIDSSLIQRLQTYPEDTTMLEVLINLGHSFRIVVVAEGVETQAQLETLRALQCFTMQGYQLSSPLSGLEAGEFLNRHYVNLSYPLQSANRSRFREDIFREEDFPLL